MNIMTRWVAGSGIAAAACSAALLLYPSEPAEKQTDDIVAITVDVPVVTVPTIDVPSIESSANDIEIGTVDILDVNTKVPAIAIGEEKFSAVNIDEIKVDLISKNDIMRFPWWQSVRDKRSLLHGKAVYDPELSAKWQKIYSDPVNNNYIMEYKPLAKGLKIISEVRCPRNTEEFATLSKRLETYRDRGFNAVLVSFDATENIAQLTTAVDYINQLGMKIIIVYSGGEAKLSTPVFRDPDIIEKFFCHLAPKATGVLLGHWRTSVHFFLPDAAYTNYIIRCARQANKDIAVIGQAYWGETAETGSDKKLYTETVVLPQNSSAVLLLGVGYPGTCSKHALKQLFPSVADFPHKIALVAGDLKHSGKNYNEAIKRQIERRLIAAGIQSILTYSADGNQENENLCQTQ